MFDIQCSFKTFLRGVKLDDDGEPKHGVHYIPKPVTLPKFDDWPSDEAFRKFAKVWRVRKFRHGAM